MARIILIVTVRLIGHLVILFCSWYCVNGRNRVRSLRNKSLMDVSVRCCLIDFYCFSNLQASNLSFDYTCLVISCQIKAHKLLKTMNIYKVGRGALTCSVCTKKLNQNRSWNHHIPLHIKCQLKPVRYGKWPWGLKRMTYTTASHQGVNHEFGFPFEELSHVPKHPKIRNCSFFLVFIVENVGLSKEFWHRCVVTFFFFSLFWLICSIYFSKSARK